MDGQDKIQTCLDTDEAKNFKFLIPYRICLIGEMDSGKSSFIINLLEQFNVQTDITEKDFQIDVYFCYSTKESLLRVAAAIKKHAFFRNFIPIEKLSNSLLDIKNHTLHDKVKSLIIFEDLQYNIRSLRKENMTKFNSFLLDSRHKSISIIYVMHEYPDATQSSFSSTFDRNFLNQSTDIIIFRSLHNKKMMNIIASRIFADQFQEFKKIVADIDEVYSRLYKHGRNHIVISADFRKNLKNLERIRFDIFEKRLCVRDC